ncbi:hypothetical protein KKI24_22210 [bacterium]|nr:hypothetical protein [bacterium]
MTSLSQYKADINSLASQLQKLLKVIRHSDPSANELKYLLHDKYQNHLTSIAREIKERFLWDDFREYLLSQTDPNQSEIPDESQTVIRRKLIKDFEKQFIARQVLPELDPPDPEEIRRKRLARKKRKIIKANQATTEKQYSKEKIMEMVQATQKKRRARFELQSLIEAIRKIDPRKIETKISQSINSKDN